jgi:hypothetical protein
MTGEKAGAEVESDEVEALEAGTRSERVAIMASIERQTVGGDRKTDHPQNFANDLPTADEAAIEAKYSDAFNKKMDDLVAKEIAERESTTMVA